MAVIAPACFETTIWSRIRDAQTGGKTALQELLVVYRPPILRFLTGKGVSSEDAEDLVQEILLAVASDSVLRKADRSQGRFRTLLLAITRNQLMNFFRSARTLKRGGHVREFSLEQEGPSGEPAIEQALAAAEGDEPFDRAWMDHLLHLALARLKSEHGEAHQLMERVLRENRTYREIAEEMGRTEDWVDHRMREARRKLAQFLRSEVLAYSSSPCEYEEELAYLSRFLGEC